MGIVPDLITFADTGAELPHTYEHIEVVNKWLLEIGFPEIVIVNYKTETLEENCNRIKSLPSLAFGFKKCSQKWKIQPQEKFMNNHQPCKDEWAKGNQIIKCIGFDFGEWHRIREFEHKKYEYYYPLVEWNWDRKACEDKLREYGFSVNKSSCYFCPAMKKNEVINLKNKYPDFYEKSLAIELEANIANDERYISEKKEADRFSDTKNKLNWALYEEDEWLGFEDSPKYPKESTVKGLGRHWTWKSIGDADDNQLKLFPDEGFDIGCGCMNG